MRFAINNLKSNQPAQSGFSCRTVSGGPVLRKEADDRLCPTSDSQGDSQKGVMWLLELRSMGPSGKGCPEHGGGGHPLGPGARGPGSDRGSGPRPTAMVQHMHPEVSTADTPVQVEKTRPCH